MAQNISKRWKKEASNVHESAITISEDDWCHKGCQTSSKRI
jgi:hypothetical protein